MNGKLPKRENKVDKKQNLKKITSRPGSSTNDAFVLLCKSELRMECVKEYKFHPVRKWRFDYAIPSALVALEVEGGVWTGGRHVSPKGFLNDMEKYNTATLMGWSVFRTTPEDLYKGKTIDLLKSAIYGDSCTKTASFPSKVITL